MLLIRWTGHALFAIGAALVLSARIQHIVSLPHLSEVEAMRWWAPHWIIGTYALCIAGESRHKDCRQAGNHGAIPGTEARRV